MIYGFSLLFLLLSLVTGLPALRALRRMGAINASGVQTQGQVITSKSAIGWLWTASYGNQDRPQVAYRSPKGEEMVLQVATSSIFPQRRYEPGQAVEVIYDKTMPGEAYVKDEWAAAVRDGWLSAAALAVAILFVVIGLVFRLPM